MRKKYINKQRKKYENVFFLSSRQCVFILKIRNGKATERKTLEYTKNTSFSAVKEIFSPQWPTADVWGRKPSRWKARRPRVFEVCGKNAGTSHWQRWCNTRPSQTGKLRLSKQRKVKILNAFFHSLVWSHMENLTCVSTVRKRSIRKKQTFQNWGKGIIAAAWG